jgi:hypothetical protein
MTEPEAAALRDALLLRPDDAELRQRYLSARTPALFRRDRLRAAVAVTVGWALLGATLMAPLGAWMSTGGGSVVLSAGSVVVETNGPQMRVQGNGATVVARNGGAAAMAVGAVGMAQLGLILGALLGLFLRAGAWDRLAQHGPLAWPAYGLGLWSPPTPAAPAETASFPADVFLLDPSHRDFLTGRAGSVAGPSSLILLVELLFTYLVLPVALLDMAGGEPSLPESVRLCWFRSRGHIVAGRVVEVRNEPWNTRSAPPARVYEVAYDYAVDTSSGRQAYSRTDRLVTKSATLRVGPADVVVDPDDPSAARLLAECEGAQFGLIVLGITAVFWLFMMLRTGIVALAWWRTHLLAHHGRLLPGSVVSCTVTRRDETDSEGDRTTPHLDLELEYRFETPAGEAMAGKIATTRDDLLDAPLPQPGTPLAILFVDAKTFEVL